MSKEIALSPEARADLEEIRQYTAERFGEGQARTYLEELRQALQNLASHPAAGVAVSQHTELRCLDHRGHYRVLYRLQRNRIEIGRIVHASREAEWQRALRALRRRVSLAPRR